MTKSKMPSAYIGREQAYIKHTILETYLQCLFMIIGQRKEVNINYVDCFAGPWEGEDEKLGDTSIGISLKQMEMCHQSLKVNFDRTVSFRALYIEKDPERFDKLQSFISLQSHPNIEAKCLKGDYTELLPEIVDWCSDYFTFFFIDPTGWKQVVGATTMHPLLRLGKCEFLINLMYSFITRFVNYEKHTEDMIEIFGEVPAFANETPEERREILLTLYRNNLKKYYQGYAAHVPIEKPLEDRILYYLVYLTRHPLGIDVFKTQAENMEIVQRITQKECKLRQQEELSGIQDMFSGHTDIQLSKNEYSDNRLMARQYLLDKLSKEPTLIDYEKWATFLEESDLYPGDLQAAIKELVKDDIAENLDADVSRRTKKVIKPNWPNKSERWVLNSQEK